MTQPGVSTTGKTAGLDATGAFVGLGTDQSSVGGQGWLGNQGYSNSVIDSMQDNLPDAIAGANQAMYNIETNGALAPGSQAAWQLTPEFMNSPGELAVRQALAQDMVANPDRYPGGPSWATYDPALGYARGGFAVKGDGDGRSDDIPARLSDGEYVIDAETVALLGNGSNKAGAEALDQFRVNVRRHKGRELAKGSFSVKAKPAEQYLMGGRAHG